MPLGVDGLGPGLSQYRYDLNDLNGAEENQITRGSKFLAKLINPQAETQKYLKFNQDLDEGASNKLYDFLFVQMSNEQFWEEYLDSRVKLKKDQATENYENFECGLISTQLDHLKVLTIIQKDSGCQTPTEEFQKQNYN